MTKPIALLSWYAAQYHYPQTCSLRSKSKTHITLNFLQNWTSLIPTSKSNCKWLKTWYDWSALEKCTLCVVPDLRVDKKIIKPWKIARIVNDMFLRKFKKLIFCFEYEVILCVFSVFFFYLFIYFYFHSHFWLSLDQQSGRVHISLKRQISITL